MSGFRAGSGGNGFLFSSTSGRKGFLLTSSSSKSGRWFEIDDGAGDGGGGASPNGSECALAGRDRRTLARRGGGSGFGFAGSDGRRLCSPAEVRRGSAGGATAVGSRGRGSAGRSALASSVDGRKLSAPLRAELELDRRYERTSIRARLDADSIYCQKSLLTGYKHQVQLRPSAARCMRKHSQNGIDLPGLQAVLSGYQSQNLFMSVDPLFEVSFAMSEPELAWQLLAAARGTYVINETPGNLEPPSAKVAHDAALEACRAVGVDAGVALRCLRQEQHVQVPRVRLELCRRELRC